MPPKQKTKAELIQQMEELTRKLHEAEERLNGDLEANGIRRSNAPRKQNGKRLAFSENSTVPSLSQARERAHEYHCRELRAHDELIALLKESCRASHLLRYAPIF